MGLPKFLTHLFPHAMACGLRRISPSPLPDDLVLPSGDVKPSASATDLDFEAVPALQGTRFPLRPTGFFVYASPVLFVAYFTTPPQAQDSIRVDG